MKIFSYITVAVTALLLGSCRDSSTIFGFETSLARVGRKSLTAEDVRKAMPAGLSGADSAGYVGAYIDKWVAKQLKLQEAELLFSASEEDIDRMVEEYRQSLLIRKVEQYYLDTDMPSEVTDADIADYYERHKADFRLTKPVVRGEIVAFGESYRRREQLLKLMQSSRSEERKDFEELCRKNNFRLVRFDEWVDFAEFLSNLPILHSSDNNALLERRGVQQIRHNRTFYCFRITEALRAGDTTPLYMVKENIRRIITNQRQSEVIRRREQQMVGDAMESGRARIFADEQEQPQHGLAATETKTTKTNE